MYEVPQNIRENNIKKYARLFEIENNLNDTIESFSHGMKQKIALISALAHEPKILIMDEPFIGMALTGITIILLVMAVNAKLNNNIIILIFTMIFTLTGCENKENNSLNNLESQTSSNSNSEKSRAEQYVESVRNGKRTDKVEVGKTYERIVRMYLEGKAYEKSEPGESVVTFNADNTGVIKYKGVEHKFTYTDSEIKSPGYYNFKYEFKDGLLYMTANTDQSVFIYQIID